jgi:hypothetical protein
MLKGAIHIHSMYSDGEFTIPELREIFLAAGCAFVGMTDHAEYFAESDLRAYIEECERLSDARLRFIPGLEYECEKRMHILGYGATHLAGSQDPQQIIRSIDEQGAISVIAHPRNDFFEWIEGFETLPKGIETWNTKYDGRYAPRPGTFALLQRLKRRRPDMQAFYGQDLHWKKQFRGMFVQVDSTSPGCDDILAALARGDYYGEKGEFQLPSSGIISEELQKHFAKVNGKSARLYRFLKNGKSLLDRSGLKVPERLKAQLRRIF